MTVDTNRVAVTVVPQQTGYACLIMSHPGGGVLASVYLTDEIIDYLMLNLPKYYSHQPQPWYGPTGPH